MVVPIEKPELSLGKRMVSVKHADWEITPLSCEGKPELLFYNNERMPDGSTASF